MLKGEDESFFVENLVAGALLDDLRDAVNEFHTASIYTVYLVALDYLCHQHLILSFAVLPFLLPYMHFVCPILSLNRRLRILCPYFEIPLLFRL